MALSKSEKNGRAELGDRFLLTWNLAGEILRYFCIADGGTNMNLGSLCCKATMFLWARGATRNPLAEALWRSTIT